MIMSVHPQKFQNECHTDEFAIPDLAEICGPRVLVDLHRDLVDTGQRMQDGEVSLRVLQLVRGQDIGVFQTQVVGFVEEPLSLDSRHVEDVQFRHGVFKGVGLHIFDIAFFEDLGADVLRDLQFLRRDEDELDVLIAGHGLQQRMDRAAELQVAAAADDHAVKAALLPGDSQKVGQGLGRMVVSAVARVDHGNVHVARRHIGRALFGVPHGDDVCEALHRPGRVRNALALGDGAVGGGGEADDVAAELIHGGLEAEPGPGRGLVEQRGKLLPLALVRIDVGVFDDVSRRANEGIDVFPAELQDVDEVFGHEALPPIQLSSDGSSRNRRMRSASPGRI